MTRRIATIEVICKGYIGDHNLEQIVKKGSLVTLSQKAIKEFYGRPARIEDFLVVGNLDNLTSNQVIEFIDIYLGFENGISIGTIERIDEDTAEVWYYCPISEKLDYSYYLLKDLETVCIIYF